MTRTDSGNTKVKVSTFDPTNTGKDNHAWYQGGTLETKLAAARIEDEKNAEDGHPPAVITLGQDGANCMEWIHSTERVLKSTRLPLMEGNTMWELLTGKTTFRDYHDALARRHHYAEIQQSGARAALRAPAAAVPPAITDLLLVVPPGAMGTPATAQLITAYMQMTGGNHIDSEATTAGDPRRLWRTRPIVNVAGGLPANVAGQVAQAAYFWEAAVAIWEDMNEEVERVLLKLVAPAFQRTGGILRSALHANRSSGLYSRYTKHGVVETDDIGTGIEDKKGRQRLVCLDANKVSARAPIIWVAIMRHMIPNVGDVTDASRQYLMTAVDQHGNSTAYGWACDDHRQVVTNIRNQIDEYTLLLHLPALAPDRQLSSACKQRTRVVGC